MRICPNCGYCDCCGRGGCRPWVRPFYPWRYDPWYGWGRHYVGTPAPCDRPRIDCGGVSSAVSRAQHVVRA